MSRRVYLLGVGVVLVALALVVTDQVISAQPGVTERNVRRIRPGMTPEEVEALLGGPAQSRELVGFPRGARECWGSPGVYERMHVVRWWLRGDVSARVEFTLRDERVRGAAFYRDEKAGPLDRLRSWLDW